MLRPLKTERQLKAVLRKHPETRELVDQYFSDARLASNILSTIATKILPFEALAACCEHADRRVSLTDWAVENWILVLGNSEIGRSAIEAVNRCVFKRATDITLNQSESWTRRSWFIIDELSEAGRLDGLVSLLKKGRSKGACVALAFQSISGLRDPKLYGTHWTDEILGQIGNRFIGRLECPVTAEWCSQLIGDQEIQTTRESETTSNQGHSHTVNRQDSIRRAVLPSELMDIPVCNRTNGLSGFYLTRSFGGFFGNMDGNELFDKRLLPKADIPEFIPRPIEHQYLRPWDANRAARFGVAPEDLTQQPPKQEPGVTPEHENLDDLFG